MREILQYRFLECSAAKAIAVVLMWVAVCCGAQQAEQPSAATPQAEIKADSKMLSVDLPRAGRGEGDRILIETDYLTAEIWPNGYVSGVKSNTLVDRKTGVRDSSFGLDIVDFLMGPGVLVKERSDHPKTAEFPMYLP
jgi:hypothetical protein